MARRRRQSSAIDPIVDSLYQSINNLKADVRAGDRTALLEGLFYLHILSGAPGHRTLPKWFVAALRAIVLESLELQTAGAKKNVLQRLRGRMEHHRRASLVAELVRRDHISLNEAYREAAAQLAREQGVHVSAQAIRQSCRRVRRLEHWTDESVEHVAVFRLQMSDLMGVRLRRRSAGSTKRPTM